MIRHLVCALALVFALLGPTLLLIVLVSGAQDWVEATAGITVFTFPLGVLTAICAAPRTMGGSRCP